MPAKNRIKTYKKDGIYHIYNRGVDKRKIFMDEQDYAVFLYLLKYYLSPPKKDETHPLANTSSAVIRPRPIENLHKEVDLLCYCLMPNHFHLLIKQITIDGMTKLVHKLLTIYSMYFNRRHKRIGHLFQGCYKAVLVDNDEQFLHLTRYIHLNPVDLIVTGSDPVSEYPYSSFGYYLGKKSAKWVKPKEVLDCFNKLESKKLFGKKYSSYKEFVFDDKEDSLQTVDKLSID
ncbi:MAG: transposase [Candidatus Beckwithbacteria bacterium]|nr:transposase [Patescibacteria group bacterium]